MMFCSDSDSSDDSDVDLMFLENCFAPKKDLGPRINLEDVSESECERMFSFSYQSHIYFVYFYDIIHGIG